MTDTGDSELAAVGEIRLGETRGADHGTIIREEVEDSLSNISSTEIKVVQPLEQSSDQTMFDLVVGGIRTFLCQLLFPTEFVHGEECRRFLSNEDIDALAIFPGATVEEYMKELSDSCKEPPSEEKVQQMKALLEDDDFIEWERRCRQLMSSAVFHSHFIRQMDTYRAKLRAYLGSWSAEKKQCSSFIYLLDDRLTAHRVPVVNQSDAIRGKLGFSKGIHAWDLRISGPMGTHFSVGVALREAPLTAECVYISMIGDDKYSWGWDLVYGNVSHDGTILGNYPSRHIYDYMPGDTIRLILNCDASTLAYAVNEMGFGVAFSNLPKEATFYPSVGLVYGNIEVSLVYLGVPPPLRNDIH